MIFFDFDGVIADLHTEWFRRFDERFGLGIDWQSAEEWDLGGLVPEEYRASFYEILNERDLYDNVRPIDGALETIWWLDAIGKRWAIATACSSVEMIAAKVDWMHRHNLVREMEGRWPKNLIPIRDKDLLRGDVLVDDGVHNLRAFQGKRILFDQPYNRNLWYGDGFDIRAEGWKEVGSILLPILVDAVALP